MQNAERNSFIAENVLSDLDKKGQESTDRELHKPYAPDKEVDKKMRIKKEDPDAGSSSTEELVKNN